MILFVYECVYIGHIFSVYQYCLNQISSDYVIIKKRQKQNENLEQNLAAGQYGNVFDDVKRLSDFQQLSTHRWTHVMLCYAIYLQTHV